MARTKQANRSPAPRATNLPMARFNDDDDDAADKNQQQGKRKKKVSQILASVYAIKIFKLCF